MLLWCAGWIALDLLVLWILSELLENKDPEAKKNREEYERQMGSRNVFVAYDDAKRTIEQMDKVKIKD